MNARPKICSGCATEQRERVETLRNCLVLWIGHTSRLCGVDQNVDRILDQNNGCRLAKPDTKSPKFVYFSTNLFAALISFIFLLGLHGDAAQLHLT